MADPAGRLAAGDRAWVVDKASAAIRRLGVAGEVRVRVVGDDEMSAAHARYSGVEGTTDVLTFDLTDGSAAESGVLDVDILVCADEAARQASARGHEPRREVLLYALHGVLHCLGHDDHDEGGFARMHALEDELLAAIGVGPTFAQPPAGGTGGTGGAGGGAGT